MALLDKPAVAPGGVERLKRFAVKQSILLGGGTLAESAEIEDAGVPAPRGGTGIRPFKITGLFHLLCLLRVPHMKRRMMWAVRGILPRA